MSEKNDAWLQGRKQKIVISIVFFLIVLLLSIISWRLLFPSYTGAVTAKIYQAGILLYTIPLYEVKDDYELSIEGEHGEKNIILVSNGKISVSEANCPDHVCVKRGLVDYSDIPIVCMPNQLVIQFEKDEEMKEVDTEISYGMS